MEVEQSETVEVAEAPEVEVTEEAPEVTEQDQISEWLDDRIGPETEAEESQESQESQPVEEPETEVAAAEVPETPRVSKAFSKVAKKEREVQQQKQELNKLKEELKPLIDAKARVDKGDMIGALDSISWTYEDATNQVLADGKFQEPKAEPAAHRNFLLQARFPHPALSCRFPGPRFFAFLIL